MQLERSHNCHGKLGEAVFTSLVLFGAFCIAVLLQCDFFFSGASSSVCPCLRLGSCLAFQLHFNQNHEKSMSCQCIDRFWAKPKAFRRIVKNSEARKAITTMYIMYATEQAHASLFYPLTRTGCWTQRDLLSAMDFWCSLLSSLNSRADLACAKGFSMAFLVLSVLHVSRSHTICPEDPRGFRTCIGVTMVSWLKPFVATLDRFFIKRL
eukprot:s257_g2.t1